MAGGYFLGRTKKMKFAMMLAGMAAGRRAGGPGELLKSGTKLLNSSPELARLSDVVRGRLLEAGKGAAMAVATRQVEALTDRVGKRVESLGDLGTSQQRSEPEREPEPAPEEDVDETQADSPAAREDEYADEPVQPSGPDTGQDTEPGRASDEEPAEPQEPARRRSARAPAAKSPRARSGGAATATVRRPASGATGAMGEATTARKGGRTRRGGSDE